MRSSDFVGKKTRKQQNHFKNCCKWVYFKIKWCMLLQYIQYNYEKNWLHLRHFYQFPNPKPNKDKKYWKKVSKCVQIYYTPRSLLYPYLMGQRSFGPSQRKAKCFMSMGFFLFSKYLTHVENHFWIEKKNDILFQFQYILMELNLNKTKKIKMYILSLSTKILIS